MSTIYEDVATLQEQVATLQAQINDTGWIELPLSENVQSYSDELKPKYRKIGKEVFLTGVIKGIVAANTVLGYLPDGYKPIRQSYFLAGSSTLSNGEASFYNCQVNVDGSVRTTTHSSGLYNPNHYLRLNGSFTVD